MTTNRGREICPLCRVEDAILYHRDKRRSYFHCNNCSLVFVPSEYHLSSIEEKAEYDLHQNDSGDRGYRKFLSRLADPLLERIKQGQRGLDFGCGPGPTLSVMFEEAGFSMGIYDPVYFNDLTVLQKRYDFITSTEVVEHFRDPQQMFFTLFNMVKPGGILAIMTKMVISEDAFKKWHYTHDLTHISFFSRNTFEFIARKYSAELEFVDSDVLFFTKSI